MEIKNSSQFAYSDLCLSLCNNSARKGKLEGNHDNKVGLCCSAGVFCSIASTYQFAKT